MAFAITPKRTVHEIFGCHDKAPVSYQHSNDGKQHISKDGFHCTCENQEFQTAFIETAFTNIHAPFCNLNSTSVTEIRSILFTPTLQPAWLRGPPALA